MSHANIMIATIKKKVNELHDIKKHNQSNVNPLGETTNGMFPDHRDNLHPFSQNNGTRKFPEFPDPCTQNTTFYRFNVMSFHRHHHQILNRLYHELKWNKKKRRYII